MQHRQLDWRTYSLFQFNFHFCNGHESRRYGIKTYIHITILSLLVTSNRTKQSKCSNTILGSCFLLKGF